jgi:hypothetical protein
MSWLMPHLRTKLRSDKVPFMNQNNANLSPRRGTVATLLYIEATVVLTLGAWLLVLGLVHEKKELSPLIGVIVFAVLGALGLFGCARGYRNGKNYGRSPAILANLIALGVAYYQIQGHFYIGAVVILVLAIPTLWNALAIIRHENP